MGIVERLADAVINQIAAGEVVERPASVVKELVENSLDADATRIHVELQGGGLERIRVADDGLGMSREDALLAIERHATSKLRVVEDLDRLRSLGFRGEAVPSIASVSRFSLITTERGKLAGTEIVIEGGRLLRAEAVGAPPGTTIDVQDLFFNVPARRKFLKRPETETSHVSDMMVRLALARPDVAFKLVQGPRTVLDAPKGSLVDPLGRIGRILGREVSDHLYPVVEAELGRPVGVRGFIGAPSLSERTPRGLYVFVNGRAVRDRTIQHAIVEGYRTLLERGRYPVVLLFLEVDPSAVDVNVHPQKTEVRFASTSDVHRAITGAITRTLLGQPWLGPRGAEGGLDATSVLAQARAVAAEVERSPERVPSALGSLLLDRGELRFPLAPGQGPPARSAQDEAEAVRILPWLHPQRSAPAGEVGPSERSWDERSTPREAPAGEVGPSERSRDERSPPVAPPAPAGEVSVPQRSGERSPPVAPPALLPRSNQRFASLRPLGQVLGTYLVCDAGDRLVLIDQHAAHERVVFERMRQQRRAGKVEVQPLLMPLVLELDAPRSAIAEASLEVLTDLGFELDPFGGGSWALKGVPAALESDDVEQLLYDVLDELRDLGLAAGPVEDALLRIQSCAACHAVVRAGDRLSISEIQALLVAMDEIDFGAHCPHGRPVFVEWSERELARLFHRS